MQFFNTNTAHNVLNVLISIVAVWGMFDWSTVGIQPQTALKIVAIMGLIKLTMNAVRDGIKGMVEQQPPVKPDK